MKNREKNEEKQKDKEITYIELLETIEDKIFIEEIKRKTKKNGERIDRTNILMVISQ